MNDTIERRKNRSYYILFVLLVIILAVLTAAGLNLSLQSDEVFSVDLIGYSWTEMLQLAIADVHPPLYYVIVKILVDIFGGMDLNSRILVALAASVLPIWILYVLSATVIRKNFGRRTALLFAGMIIGMPSLIHIFSEARMYGWGVLFITVAYLMVVFIVQGKASRATWIVLMICAIAACYTHYFGDAAIFYIYVFLLLWAIKYRKDIVRRVLIQAAIIVASFLPWMIGAMFSQVGGVEEDYWMEQGGITSLSDNIKFLLAPYTNARIVCTLLEVLLGAIVLWMIVRFVRTRQWEMLCLVAIPACLLLTGKLMDVLFRPVYDSRYAILGCGASCLGIAIGLSQILQAELSGKDKTSHQPVRRILAVGAMLIIFAISAIDDLSFIKNQWSYREHFATLDADLLEPAREAAARGETVSIITDSAYFHSALAFYLPQATIYSLGYEKGIYSQRQSEPENLEAYTGDSRIPDGEVWVVHSPLYGEELLEMIDVSGVEPVHTQLEQIEMLIYHLSKEV